MVFVDDVLTRLRLPCAKILLALSLFAISFLPTIAFAADKLEKSDSPTSDPARHATLVVVVGAAGDDTYAKVFDEELALWRTVAKTSDVDLHVVGDPSGKGKPENDAKPDKERLQNILAEQSSAASAESPLWLVFVGHGTFDGRAAAFNLRGPDLQAAELAAWLQDVRRPLAIVNTTAASGPFVTTLSAPGRVVITATKSGQERSYARFGRYFAKRVIDPTADLDKDDQTSLFEAFLAAGRDTLAFYKSEGRITTEHPLLDDNGDGRGVRVEFFEGSKLSKAPSGNLAADGDLARRFHLHPNSAERQLTAQQAAERDRLETAIAQLRQRKSTLAEDEYFAELERLLVLLAKLYQGP